MATPHAHAPPGRPAVHDASQAAYWRAHHRAQPYAGDARPYADYATAYQAGIEGHAEHGGGDFDAHAVRLRSNYERRPGARLLGWDQGAALACRAAWERAEAWRHGDLGRQT